MIKVGRNQPCPCGSGKKYKKCCYRADAASVSQNELVRIGPEWVKHHVSRLLDLALTSGTLQTTEIESEPSSDLLALYNALTSPSTNEMSGSVVVEEVDAQELGDDAEVEVNIAMLRHSQLMNDKGEILKEIEVSPVLRSVSLPASNRRDRRLYSQLKLSLSQSVFEPFEVIEVLRGSGLKIRGILSGRTLQINQASDAALLEPMEWIYGRVVIFEKRAYLLEGWEKVIFKQRKALKASIKSLFSLIEESVPISALRSNASHLLDCCREHQVQRLIPETLYVADPSILDEGHNEELTP